MITHVKNQTGNIFVYLSFSKVSWPTTNVYFNCRLKEDLKEMITVGPWELSSWKE